MKIALDSNLPGTSAYGISNQWGTAAVFVADKQRIAGSTGDGGDDTTT